MTMSATKEPEPSAIRQAAGRPRLRLIVLLPLVVIVVILVGGRTWEIGFHVATGWIGFLTRTIPRISLNWDLIATGTICGIAVLALAHSLLRSLATPILATWGAGRSWRWRWTWCGMTALGVLFLVGMSAGGIVHQAAWIRSSPQPWYERKGGLSVVGELRSFRMIITMAANDHDDDVTRMRMELMNAEGEWIRRRRGEPAPFEKFICLLVLDDARKFSGAILFPRDPEQWKRRDVIYHWTNTEDEFRPMLDLPSLLKQHEGHLLAL